MVDWPKNQESMEKQTPTIKVAAERPYCAKHSRAMLVIGGEKKCASCLKEQRDAEESLAK